MRQFSVRPCRKRRRAVIQSRGIGVMLDDALGLSATTKITSNSSMGELVNLRLSRKQGKADAAINRLAHGRSQCERALAQSRNEKARKHLDQQRIKTGEER